MRIFADESGQAGGIAMLVIGLLAIGFFYVAFGTIMNQVNTATNTQISGSLPHSQTWSTQMDFILKFWWGFPIFAVICFVIFSIKNALTKDPGEV